MKKTVLCSVLVLLGLMLGAFAAAAAVPAPASPVVPVCTQAQAQTAATAPAPFLAPEPQRAAICPEIGCVNDQYCRRSSDCTTAPNGVCNLFCPTRGCCSYPAL